MPHTVTDLIIDVVPRLRKAPKGLTVYQAATAVQSLIYKRLIDKDSDLAVISNDFFYVIPPYDYVAPLPADFIAMAERPKAIPWPEAIVTEGQRLLTESQLGILTEGGQAIDIELPDILASWMTGQVVSYVPSSKELVINVTSFYQGAGSAGDTLKSWNIAVGAMMGQQIQPIDTSPSAIALSLGPKTLTTATQLQLFPGQNIILSDAPMPVNQWDMRRMDQGSLLVEDDSHDYFWWNQYGSVGRADNNSQRSYQIIGNNLYVTWKSSEPLIITAKYKARPVELNKATSVIPWNDFFYDVFREGVARMISKGMTIVSADSDVALFVREQIDTILHARFKPLPERRMRRSDYI